MVRVQQRQRDQSQMKSGLRSCDRIKIQNEMCNYQKQGGEEMSSRAASSDIENGKQSAGGPAVPTNVVHSVAMTDTFASLGVKYGVSPIAIQRLNGFKLGDNVYSRREILIPIAQHSKACDSSKGANSDNTSSTSAKGAANSGASESDGVASLSVKKDFKSFLSRFDSNIKDIKSKTDQLLSQERSSPLAPISPRPEGLTRLNYGSMTSVTGKLEAQNQALDVIGCILMSDPKVRRFTGRGTPTTPDLTPGSSASTLVQQKIEVGPPSHDDENDLDQDTDIFDL